MDFWRGTMHPNTLHKFIRRNDIKTPKERYSNISDVELRSKLDVLSVRFPNSGIQEMMAHLLVEDPPVQVQRYRVQNILSQVDTVGTAKRWAQAVSRRKVQCCYTKFIMAY